jgi:hypothetical protein
MAGAYTLDQYNAERVKLESEASSASFATVDRVPANRFCLAHMPSNEDEANKHWHDCKLKSCEFSALHYDDDPNEVDLQAVLEKVGQFPYPFGRTSSQGAESYASKMEKQGGARRGSAFQMAVTCFNAMLHDFYTNRKLYEARATGGYALSSKATNYLQRRKEDLSNYAIVSCEVVSSDKVVGTVRAVSSLACLYAVTLLPGEHRSECSCRTPAIRSLPCVHACKLAMVVSMNLERLVHDSFTTSAGLAAFADPAQTVPVDTSTLEPAQVLLIPPVNAPKRGRPRVKRLRGPNEPKKR